MKTEDIIRDYIFRVEGSTFLLYDKRKLLYVSSSHNDARIDELDKQIEHNEGIMKALLWVLEKEEDLEWYRLD
jgi:hypothetical protein